MFVTDCIELCILTIYIHPVRHCVTLSLWLLQDKESACPADGTCGLANLNSTSPNARTLPGGLVEFAAFSDNFVDDRTLNNTRVGIVNNVGLVTTAAAMKQTAGTWEQCLQGFGEFTKNRICDSTW